MLKTWLLLDNGNIMLLICSVFLKLFLCFHHKAFVSLWMFLVMSGYSIILASTQPTKVLNIDKIEIPSFYFNPLPLSFRRAFSFAPLASV
jgi:hypothetical protein